MDLVPGRGVPESTREDQQRHIQTLANAELLSLDKMFDNRRPRTWVDIISTGRAALHTELAAMRDLLSRIETDGPQ